MSSRSNRLRRAALCGAAFALLAAGCGLKAETYQSLRQSGGSAGLDGTGGGGGTVNPDGTVTNPDGTVSTPGTNTGTGGTGTGTGGTGTGTGGTGTGGNTGTGTGGNTGGGMTGGTTIGITPTKITIGIHAPLTGASPLPQNSFAAGAKNYWKGKKVYGREVELFVMDDTYKPSGAIRACQEMARKHFIVVGGAGADQIQACARDRTLASTHTPYISAGVTENGLRNIPTYFAASLTYREQAPLVIEMAKRQNYLQVPAGKKWAVVTSDTPNFEDARKAMTDELTKNGIPFDVHLVPKAGSDSDAFTLSNRLRGAGYPVVYFLGQPTFFIKVVGQTQNATYHPIWTGVGVSMGVNAVAGPACDATTGSGGYDGRFLSPFPGLDRQPDAFRQADGGRNKDDIELTLWGFSEFLHQALLLTGGNLTRENFMASLEKATIKTSVFPAVKYSPSDHFGGTGAYMLKSDCQKKQYVTVDPMLNA